MFGRLKRQSRGDFASKRPIVACRLNAGYSANSTVAKARVVFSGGQRFAGPGDAARSAIELPCPASRVTRPLSLATVTTPSSTKTPYAPSIAPPHAVVPLIPRVATGVTILTSVCLRPSTSPPVNRKTPFSELRASEPAPVSGW